jgi:hypothetical protein
VFNDDHPPERGAVLLLELGTTIGLVLAHGFASWISATDIHAPSEEVDQWDVLRVQLGGALAVAVLGMLAVLVTPTSIELAAPRFTAAATIGALVSSKAARATPRFEPPWTASLHSLPA